MKISLFNYSMLGYILYKNLLPPYLYIFWSNPCFKIHTPDWALGILLRNITIIRDLCGFLQPALISTVILCKKLDFATVNHKRYINLRWAEFPMIGNTCLELKLLKNPCYNNKVTRKIKDLQNFLRKKFTSLFNLIRLVIVLNTNFQILFIDKLP